MQKLGTLLTVACCAGALFAWPAEGSDGRQSKTDLLVFFDTEAFTDPDVADGILDMANAMTEEGVTAHFAIVGKMAESLEKWGRTDILAAIGRHKVATHSYGHSVHPMLTEIADELDYKSAYARIRAEESASIATLKRLVPGVEHVLAFVPPGDNEPYVAQYAYRDMGLKFACGVSFCPDEAGDDWYCGLFQIPYVYNFELFLPGRRACDPKAIADKLAKSRRAIIFNHPHRVIADEAWDILNYRGANPPAGAPYKKAVKKWTPEGRAQYIADIRRTVRYLKNDPRFNLTTVDALVAQIRPRERMQAQDAPYLYETLQAKFGPVDRRGWCLADVFRGTVRFLRGERQYDPTREFGFLEMPVGVTAPCEVSATDLREAAKKMNIDSFLPASITVGGVTLGPRDFLMAALEVLATDKSTVRVEPVDSQLGSFERMPKLEKKHYGQKTSWCIYSPDLKGDRVSDLARLQLWTIRKGL